MYWKKVLGALGALLLLLAACQPKANVLEVHDAWSRPSLAGGNAAVYFVIVNGASENDSLLSVSTDIAASSELHMSMSEGNDVMTMSSVSDVPVPAHQSVEFSPGGYHVMLVNLSKALKAGDTFPIRLVFQNAGTLQVQVAVKEQ